MFIVSPCVMLDENALVSDSETVYVTCTTASESLRISLVLPVLSTSTSCAIFFSAVDDLGGGRVPPRVRKGDARDAARGGLVETGKWTDPSRARPSGSRRRWSGGSRLPQPNRSCCSALGSCSTCTTPRRPAAAWRGRTDSESARCRRSARSWSSVSMPRGPSMGCPWRSVSCCAHVVHATARSARDRCGVVDALDSFHARLTRELLLQVYLTILHASLGHRRNDQHLPRSGREYQNLDHRLSKNFLSGLWSSQPPSRL